MAFPGSLISTFEIMISVFFVQHTAIRQDIDYLKQFIKILVLLFRKLQILFKLTGKLYILSHTSSTSLSSAIL